MSTLPVAHPETGPSGILMADRRPPSRAAGLLAAALLVIVLYAAFAHGAASNSTNTRVQLAIAVVAAIAGIAGLWSGVLRFAAPRLALAGIALLAAFAVWSGLTVFWSVAPDQTWIELNRSLTYVILLALAVAVGASDARAPRWIAAGFFTIALLVTLYALGQKLIPGVHLSGIISLNQNGPLPRLQEPFGYWNALALFVGMGVPIALAIASDWTALRRTRLGALVALVLMLLVISLTYSRGGMIALVVALVVGVGLSGARLRSLMWLALACVALIPPLAFGLSDHALTTANVELVKRESAGLELAAILAGSLLVLIVAARRLFVAEATVSVDDRHARTVGKALGGLLLVAVVVGFLAVAFSSRGIGGTISHEWNNFTATRATSVYQPGRLLSVDSENRWVWWKEAAGAFTARPLAGWGAGSFPVLHLLYRRDTLSVNQPHSVPLQFLAETGVIGAALAIVGFVLLVAAVIRAVRRQPRERLLWAALLAAAVMYCVHALYDWDWDIPGVTLPALVFLGVLAGASRSLPDRELLPTRKQRPDRWIRVVAVALLVLWLCTFALSVELPSLAASDASAADVEAASASPATLAQAQSDARLAARLDPLSDAGPRVEATIAARQGRLTVARADLLDAVNREPADGQAWLQLAYVESALHDPQAAAQAAGRVLALDPHAAGAARLASNFGQAKTLDITPPHDSPTAAPLSAR